MQAFALLFNLSANDMDEHNSRKRNSRAVYTNFASLAFLYILFLKKGREA